MIVYGPVPSRRLGRSLGVNNIPAKHCSYSCVYCQVGKTNNLTINRQEFYKPKDIYNEVKNKITFLEERKEKIDYISFVPDGEPTLDINLRETIGLLKEFGIKIAVITNSTLLHLDDVREDLALADWVSVKIDSTYKDIWQKVNNPHKEIDFELMLDNITRFSEEYKGTLVTETMLVGGINDCGYSLYKTAQFIKNLYPNKVYMLVPIRPPADTIKKVSSENIQMAVDIYSTINNNFELINYAEDNNFSFASNVEEELLSITSVHPMRKDAINQFLEKAGATWEIVEQLKSNNKIVEISYEGNLFYKNNN